MSKAIFRRKFLQKSFSLALQFSLVTLILESCKSKDSEEGKVNSAEKEAESCDPSKLSMEDIKKRESLGYVEKSPAPNKHCGNCNLWLPPGEIRKCGKCQLFKGPVPAEAYCTYWAPQV